MGMAEELPAPLADSYAAPVRPGLEFSKVPHALHLLLTVVFFPWLLVWIAAAIWNEAYNARLTREHEAAMARYRVEVREWQERCMRDRGWVPQLPE